MDGGTPKTIAVVGAGIVGVSTAIWLRRDGHKVTLIDRVGPAAGASYGNGGVLASCAVVPVTGPGLVRKAPGMLLDRNQPLFLKWGYLPRLAPWLIKYLKHANRDDTRRISSALSGVTLDSLAEHQSLASGTPAERWIVPSDYLYVYESRAQFEADAFAWALRHAHGIVWDELEKDALKEYDHVFGDNQCFAVRMADHGRISDPGRYVTDLCHHFEAIGGRLLVGDAQNVILEKESVVGLRVSGDIIACDTVVLTAGVWSGEIAKQLGLRVPLETERGYHLELWNPSVSPRAPTMFASGKFVATPMEGRLRLAGIVEFGGLKAPPSKAPFELLLTSAMQAMPGLSWEHKTEWMGHRPAPADSIPIIGGIPNAKGAYAGFGHHHIGLTAGPKTGRMLAGLISNRISNLDLEPYSPARFAG